MTEFYNKTSISLEWTEMLSIAKSYFDTHNQNKYNYHQCVVLYMDDGEQIVYPIAVNSVDDLLQESSRLVETLKRRSNNNIKRIICMWDDYSIDVTDFAFRKKICELNKENEKAFILLSGGADIYHAKQIADTFPCKTDSHIKKT